MSFSEEIRCILDDLGQVAVEVLCPIDGYREFVSVFATPKDDVVNFAGRFPYFGEATTLYRCIRFRVNSVLIEQDADVHTEDLVGLQENFLPSEETVEFVLRIWKVPNGELKSPRYVEIPV